MRYTVFAVLAAIATAAVAQPPAAPPAGERPDRTARWQEHKAEFEAMRKRRADDVALLIGLRASQRPAFDAMMAAMEPPHRRPGEGKPGGPEAGAGDEGTEARIARMSARLDEHNTEAKAKLAALKTFYAGLTPEQRQRFDALDRLRHDHDRMAMHGGWGGHGDHEGPGGPPPPPMG